jgi:mono/diheme cytochrome c family protein
MPTSEKSMNHSLALASLLLATFVTISTADDTISFNRDVRTILADKCYACHGPDENKREADLRLDVEADAKADRDGHQVIAPGKPAQSELLRRLTTDDPDERMPPGSSGRSISEAQIATLTKWIAEGATWEQHWSLIPPKRYDPPQIDSSRPLALIDRFVQRKLAQQGLQSASATDRRTLIRRLSFDLTGLPPTAEQVAEFIANESPDAYERIVDRLLDSQHYGERMAIYWLDVVRYADTGGYHSDNQREVSPYRDYVIRAFNENQPFNQFTIEQIAGDLLPDATNQQKIASGYNRLLQTTQEGGAQAKEYTAKYQADRVRNTATAWLGLTMGCCECHDHKFDPLSMRDFYSFAAFFADVQEIAVGHQKEVALATPEQEQQVAKLEQALSPLREKFAQTTPELLAGLKSWEATARRKLLAQVSDWQSIKPASVVSSGGATLTVQDDLTVLTSGTNPAKDTYTVVLTPSQETVTGIRLEALTHKSLAKKSLSRGNGNFVLTEISVSFVVPGADPRPIKIKTAIADFSQKDHPISNAIDGKSNTGWAVDGHNQTKNRSAVFVFAEPVKLSENATLEVVLRHDSQYARHNIGRFRMSTTDADKPALSENSGLSAAVATALKADPDGRNDSQRATLLNHYRSIAAELAETRKQIATHEGQLKAVRAAFPKTLISISVTPRIVRMLPRGNWLDDTGDIVSPATPLALPALEIGDRQQARRQLGEWFVARDNPLTSRVFVNRLWKLFFGRGIVKSLDDFGTQGAWPTHPELLDTLSVDFMENGWNVKRMVKQIVMSQTYQLSSRTTPAIRECDPNNQWLARQSRFRLDAEMVRDNALAISGLLNTKVGGPSVKPYQPVGYWQHLNFPKRKWTADMGENAYRRGLYTYWQRTFLHPSLLAFDAPSREECTVERPRSNTPLQALVLLNDPTYVEAARRFAELTIQQGGATTEQRLAFAFQKALNRNPGEDEQTILVGLYEEHLADYQKDKASAALLAKIGYVKTAADIDVAELAAWTSVTRVILNLHETITRY